MSFHSKLNLNNFMFYDLVTKDVLNYVWSENNGDIKSSSFVTCYVDFLTKSLKENPSLKEIILWSDGCTYQNRFNSEIPISYMKSPTRTKSNDTKRMSPLLCQFGTSP